MAKNKRGRSFITTASRVVLITMMIFLVTHTRIENREAKDSRFYSDNPKLLSRAYQHEYISELPGLADDEIPSTSPQINKKQTAVVVSEETNTDKVVKTQNAFTNKTKEWKKGNAGMTAMLTVKMPTEEDKKIEGPKIKKIYEERQRVLNDYCGKRTYAWSSERQMVVDPDHLVSLCFVQKAGSTNWIRSVFTSAGKTMYATYREQAKEAIEQMSDSMIDKLTYSQDGTRIITVRHPFSRLVSGWHNKLQMEFIKQHNGHNLMLDTMPDLAEYANAYPDDTHYISFKGFVHYVVEKGIENLDPHFQSINHHCDPCGFPFDFIVKSETGPVFGWYILERFNGTLFNFKAHIPDSTLDAVSDDKIAKPPTVDEAIKTLQEIEVIKIREIFKDVPVNHIKKLMEMLKSDFEMFGYGFDIKTLTISI